MSFFQIERSFYIGAKRKSEVKRNKLFMNHSCNPNVGYCGQIIFVAMRDIGAGEELTFDWAMGTDESIFGKDLRFPCRCGSPKCRKVLTAHDWSRRELQSRYKGYFSTYIQKRVSALQSPA